MCVCVWCVMGMNCVDVYVWMWHRMPECGKQASDFKRFTQIKINRITQLFQSEKHKKISKQRSNKLNE